MTRAAKPQDLTSPAYWSGIVRMSLSKFFVLSVLQTRALHGYEVARAVARMTDGCCAPTEGTIYPVLKEFEAGGYVSARVEVVGGRERKTYEITDRGREAFRVAVQAWTNVARHVGESARCCAPPSAD